MAGDGLETCHSPKRRKLNGNSSHEDNVPHQSRTSRTLRRPISQPAIERRGAPTAEALKQTWDFGHISVQTSNKELLGAPATSTEPENEPKSDYIASPFQLTHIEDLAPHQNVDAVKLRDILGDPMIKECWNFNFLFDIDYVMSHLDDDVRDMVRMKIVHGFWRKDDERRLHLLVTAERYPNVELIHAYVPDPFGTHHSKMLVIIRHDDTARVLIHTANMISRDWSNLTQAVWQSPFLPFLKNNSADDDVTSPIGSGLRFKIDLLGYLGAYKGRVRNLVQQLTQYDFSQVRAAFLGSAPSRQRIGSINPAKHTSFGWLGLEQILSTIPSLSWKDSSRSAHIVIQISSIATSTPAWHTHLQSTLARHSPKRGRDSKSSLKAKPPKFNIIFPTPEEIRNSLDGYGSGASIHIKLQSAQQQKQLEHLRPLLCRWSSPSPSSSTLRREALRGQAAPHIKTYIRFSDEQRTTIDWAMVTSANLSQQAWGGTPNKNDQVWIQSWETGVVVWPALFEDAAPQEPGQDKMDVVMVPVFGRDRPCDADARNIKGEEGNGNGNGNGNGKEVTKKKFVVGLRMPYDFPLTPYKAVDNPWCATMSYEEADWKGQKWAD